MSSINWKVSKADALVIRDIVARAMKEYDALEIPRPDAMNLTMDLTAAHLNGCPLELDALLNTKRTLDFTHDIGGIQRHINRETGSLENCFLPRFAQREAWVR